MILAKLRYGVNLLDRLSFLTNLWIPYTEKTHLTSTTAQEYSETIVYSRRPQKRTEGSPVRSCKN